MKLNFNNQSFEFKPISIDNKDFFMQMPDGVEHISCEYSFVNLFMWGERYNIQWCNFNDFPLVFIVRENVLLFPLCKGMTSEKLKSLSRSFIEAGGSGNITQVPEYFIKANPDLKDFYKIRENRNFADYLHLSEKLSSLKGRKLSKKRNLISQFIRNNPDFEDLPLTPELFDGCLNLVKTKIITGNTGHEDEMQAIKLGFSHFAELGLEGRVIISHNEIAAFSVFTHHIDDSYLIHYEKSNHEFKGASQLINLKTAQFLVNKCKYINREQDLGIPGLRKAKISYDPDKILINYDLC